MKTTAKEYTAYGNTAIIQIRIEPETTIPFLPGAPEIKSGGLVISEKTTEGIVGKLVADNRTKSFLLLTDADVLTGARQNRIINQSILLAPLAQTIIDVSCIERLRWHYTEKNFSNPDSAADPDLRMEKAASEMSRISNPADYASDTQGKVWEHVNRKLRDKKMQNATESYADYLMSPKDSMEVQYPKCEAGKGCNGIAVITGKKITCIDVFGTEEVYRHYFPMLREAAFRMALTGARAKTMDIHEAYYKVLDSMDEFFSANKLPRENYYGAGSFSVAETGSLIGYDLSFEGQIIHDALFGKVVSKGRKASGMLR